MQAFWILLRRELGSYFGSFTGYSIIAAVLLLLGISFIEMLSRLNVQPTEAPVTELFFLTLYFWLILLLTTPIITMRSFALEKFSGTYETLMTAPVRDVEVVLAKFFGALAFYLITWMPLLGYLLIVRRYSNGPIVFDGVLLASTLVGMLLIGSVYIALGCFASAITRSQIVAAMISYALGVGLFLVSLRGLTSTTLQGWRESVFKYVSMSEHMQDFARGVVDTRSVTFYLSATVLFLYLTTKVIESRRWR
jgi:ABC-2 type transport system permease protein